MNGSRGEGAPGSVYVQWEGIFYNRSRTTVPSDWTSVQIRQGSQTRTATVQKDGAESYAQYAIAPNGGVARLQRAR